MAESLGPVVEAIVHSRDVARAVDFHRRAFFFDVLETGPGVLMGVSGTATGFIRFLAAATDDRRPRPAPWETGPRLLGVYSRDLDRTREAAEAAGAMVGPLVRYDYGDSMRECIVQAPDDLYWTVPQVSPRRPSPALDRDAQRLHGELHSAVVNVSDMDSALAFFAAAGGLDVLFDGVLSGPPIRDMIGLPEGASLRLAFLASSDQAPARLELMQFFGVEVEEPAARTVGLRRLVFTVEGVEAVTARLLGGGGLPLAPGLLVGPAGVEIELRERRP